MTTNVAEELREIAKRESKYGKLIPSHLLELARQLDDERHQRETEDHIQDKEMDDLRAEVRELRAVLKAAWLSHNGLPSDDTPCKCGPCKIIRAYMEKTK